MSWLAIIQLIIKAVAGVADYLGSRQLLEAGQAQSIADGLRATLSNIQKASEVANEMCDNPDGPYADGVREKYTRPDETPK